MAAFFRGFPLTPSFSCRLPYFWYIDTAPGHIFTSGKHWWWNEQYFVETILSTQHVGNSEDYDGSAGFLLSLISWAWTPSAEYSAAFSFSWGRLEDAARRQRYSPGSLPLSSLRYFDPTAWTSGLKNQATVIFVHQIQNLHHLWDLLACYKCCIA